MKYDCINKDRLKESLTYWKYSKSKFKGSFGSIHSEEEFIEHITKNKFSSDDISSLCAYRDNPDLIMDDSMVIFNKLIGDHKLLKKMRRVADGSYLSNRICLFTNAEEEKLLLSIDIDSKVVDDKALNEFYSLSNTKQEIDWIYNHFDYIFIQIPKLDSRFGLELKIESDTYCAKLDAEIDYYDSMQEERILIGEY